MTTKKRTLASRVGRAAVNAIITGVAVARGVNVLLRRLEVGDIQWDDGPEPAVESIEAKALAAAAVRYSDALGRGESRSEWIVLAKAAREYAALDAEIKHAAATRVDRSTGAIDRN